MGKMTIDKENYEALKGAIVELRLQKIKLAGLVEKVNALANVLDAVIDSDDSPIDKAVVVEMIQEKLEEMADVLREMRI